MPFVGTCGRAALGLMLCLAFGSASASLVIFDRGLPSTNLNNVAGPNRSNVAWGFGEAPPSSYYAGDTFRLGAGQWRIDTIRTWAVIGPTSDNTGTLIADRYSSISLFAGDGSAPLANLSSGNTIGNFTDNPNISIAKVQYTGSLDYEGTTGNQLNIFEVTFNNLNWIVNGNTDVYFSVVGVDNPTESTYRPWFAHASNAALGASPSDGADNLYNWFEYTGGTLTLGPGAIDSNVDGWDKSSDINVQVEGERIPEPATLVLAGMALASLAFRRSRRQLKE